MRIMDFILRKHKASIEDKPDDKRPVKFVRERPNVWRVVYADDRIR